MEAGLYLVGTPIGNLGDITYRAVETLRSVALILAEDTRHTLRLLAHLDIHKPLQSCHKFNEASRVQGILERIRAGAAVALVSSAGMPAVSDPGARVVRAAREAGLPVWVIPGPSAVTTAAALSGYGDRGFHFEGFLPPKSGARGRRLDELLQSPCPVVLFEAPYRVLRLLGELGERLADRPVFVARELTKKFEETLEGPADEVARKLEATGGVRGEFVLVLPPAPKRRGGASRGKIDTTESGC